MSPAQLEVQVLAAVVAAACALPGVFLVLRHTAMMSDTISHAILPGIVVAFFLTGDLSSPLLLVAAAGTGVLTVALVSLLVRTRLLREDASMGLVFSALFALGVVLVSRFAGDVHLDTDAVLLGEIAFAPLDRLQVGSVDLGPRTLWVMSGVLVLNAAFVTVFYKELELTTFDAGLAAALGFLPGLVHYLLMGLVSITAVGAFDAVGSILVVALMVAPAATARLLTNRLGPLLLGSVAVGMAAALGGYWLARALDANIAGAMATTAGILFVLAWTAAPDRGLVAGRLRARRRRVEFAQATLTIHLLHHADTPAEADENDVEHLRVHIGWSERFARDIVERALRRGLVEQHGSGLHLTTAGSALAAEYLGRA
jgi:manganese/zinc/iron transport system permease protein